MNKNTEKPFVGIYDPNNTNDFFDNLAKYLGVERYSEEYNHFLWTKLLGVSEEVYKKIDEDWDVLNNGITITQSDYKKEGFEIDESK